MLHEGANFDRQRRGLRESAADRAFYNGKVAVANFFVKNMLPRLTADRGIAANVDLAIMDLREEAF